MKKLNRTLILFCSLLICFSLSIPSLFASNNNSKRIYDYAHLLDATEIENLEATISEIEANYNHDIYILTTDNTEGKTSTAYADDFFFNLGYGNKSKSGVLLLIDMDNRNVWISTAGETVQYLTDARIQCILDSFWDDVVDGNFYKVCKIFLKDMETVYENPIPTGSDAYSLPKAKLTTEDYVTRGLIAAAIALVVSIITYFCICRSYTHPRFAKPIANPDRNTIDFTNTKDQFVHTHTTKVRIHDDSNSGGHGGGGSSTHTSSGGGTFGGGGRSF